MVINIYTSYIMGISYKIYVYIESVKIHIHIYTYIYRYVSGLGDHAY